MDTVWDSLKKKHVCFPLLCAETFAFSYWSVHGCTSEESPGENFSFFFFFFFSETLLSPLL